MDRGLECIMYTTSKTYTSHASFSSLAALPHRPWKCTTLHLQGEYTRKSVTHSGEWGP